MAGTTTNFAIPYPTATDYVTDGATAMKSIADQVDAVMFTGASSGNLLINGAMQVSQRRAVGVATGAFTTGGYYTADRWYTSMTTLGTWQQTTQAQAPTGSGFRNSLKMDCTVAEVSPAANSLIRITQAIEGQNLQAIRKGTASAQTLTLSFWVASFQTGTFICELVDIDNNRSVSKSYTVNASNTFEYKTITFPADTTGALDNDNGESFNVNWWLGAGSTFTSGTLQTTWGTLTSANRAVGQTNSASATTGEWYMTGAQLTVGSVATPFEFKSFADDLRACQRYYEKSYVQGVTVGSNDNNGLVLGQSSTGGDSYWYFQIEYKVTKRTKDVTATFYNSTGATSLWSWGRSGSSGNNVPAIQYQSDNWLQIYIYGGAAWAAMQAVGHYVVSAEL